MKQLKISPVASSQQPNNDDDKQQHNGTVLWSFSFFFSVDYLPAPLSGAKTTNAVVRERGQEII